MKLIYLNTKKEVKVGDTVQLSDGEYRLEYITPPHKPSSTGRVGVSRPHTSTAEYYPSVIGAEWIEREDQQDSPVPVVAKAKKQRTHNEYFRTVSLNNRKSCPSCKVKLPPGEKIWSWGEYLCAKWRTILHFCRNCYPHQVKGHLTSHTADCGCKVELIGYRGEQLPQWLTLHDKE